MTDILRRRIEFLKERGVTVHLSPNLTQNAVVPLIKKKRHLGRKEREMSHIPAPDVEEIGDRLIKTRAYDLVVEDIINKYAN